MRPPVVGTFAARSAFRRMGNEHADHVREGQAEAEALDLVQRSTP
jgi:hypothetical protein